MAVGFGTGVVDDVVLPVEAGDEHGTSVFFATRLVGRNCGRAFSFGGGVAKAFAEAAPAELIGTAEKLNGVIRAERRDARLHRAVMLVA